jgi:arylsulfatase
LFILICCVGIVTLLVQSAAAQAGSKQNIILIIGDDIGWGDLGVYGGGEPRNTHSEF